MTTLLTRIQNRTNQDAFTLIEALVATVIVAILAAISFPVVLGNGTAAGHDNAVRADLTQYAVAMAEYRVDHGLEASASIDAQAFKDVQHSEGSHFAVISQGVSYCVFGYSESGEHTKAAPLVITESNLTGTASCTLQYNPKTLVWN